MFKSTKKYGHEVGLSCCFRQWRAKSHCNMLHGYALSVKLTFEADSLDHRNWVVDFGGLREVKDYLTSTFDHALLVAKDDPHLWELNALHSMGLARVVEVEATGCEAFAKKIFEYVQFWLSEHVSGNAPRVRLHSVEVAEHGANSAIYEREPS